MKWLKEKGGESEEKEWHLGEKMEQQSSGLLGLGERKKGETMVTCIPCASSK